MMIRKTSSFEGGTTRAQVRLREIQNADLPIFFEQQLDRQAIKQAAFTSEDPADRAAFDAHWARIRADDQILLRTILLGDQVAGYLASFERFGTREISYWLGRPFWGCGVATSAVQAFLQIITLRPLYARAASDNLASLRVLEKNGFRILRHEVAFAAGRGKQIEEAILVLDPEQDRSAGL